MKWIKKDTRLPIEEKDGIRVLTFSPIYPKDSEMRHRIMNSQFVKICSDVTHWRKLDEPCESKNVQASESNCTIQIVVPCFFIRSFTNNKERAKQYFTVVKSDNYSESLIIRKLVLSENLKLYGGISKIIKQFKDHYLFEQLFSIKIETFKTVMSVLNGDIT